MKRLFALFTLLLFLTGCAGNGETQGKPSLVATLFPQYDFAREICKDKMKITLLLPPGADSHSYEPTPSDMVQIKNADAFLYTGENMEPWAKKLSENTGGAIVDVSRGAKLLSGEDIHSHEKHENAHLSTDPHIWTNPQNAIVMVKNICAAVCDVDPENAPFYTENAKVYIEKLENLDRAFEEVVSCGKRKKIIFGGHFAMRYFVDRYDLTYRAAYDACDGNAEPSPAVLIELIREIKEESIPAVYYEELSTPRTASLIAEETGAKKLLLHSCHNIGREDRNETYLSLMEKNLENLKIGLN